VRDATEQSGIVLGKRQSPCFDLSTALWSTNADNSDTYGESTDAELFDF